MIRLPRFTHATCWPGAACPACTRAYRRRHAASLATLAVSAVLTVWIIAVATGVAR